MGKMGGSPLAGLAALGLSGVGGSPNAGPVNPAGWSPTPKSKSPFYSRVFGALLLVYV